MRGRQHSRATKQLLGWDIPEVHVMMDIYSKQLGGRHRLLGHDLKGIRTCEEIFGRRGRVIACCHWLQDLGALR